MLGTSISTSRRVVQKLHIMKTSIQLVITFLCLSAAGPKTQAVVPPPDGGYPGGNTAEGQNALFNLAGGGFNTAVGWLSLRTNGTGSFNTGIGAGTLLANNGEGNTATGTAALLSNTIGGFNTANGNSALFSNIDGDRNVADGTTALYNNTTGDGNTAIGFSALFNNTTGLGNIAMGISAGFNVFSADNVIAIGALGANVTNSCYIGNIAGQPVDPATAAAVYVDGTNKLGTTSSSRRFKQNIKSMDQASEAIRALKPVTFNYRSDAKNTPCFGLIAEDVAAVNPALVVHDKDGKPYSVRYEQINAMLLNEFLKEHRKVEELAATVGILVETVKEQAAQLREVMAQAQIDHSAAQVVVSNH
jgi:hypothetical protein